MTLISGFHPSISGDRKVGAEFFDMFFGTLIGNGVFPNPSTGVQVVEGTGMQTIVRPGRGWVNGRFLVNPIDYTLQHDLADGTLKRIDRVVMKLDYSDRLIKIEIKKGAFASSPVAPILQRDGNAYELALADVLIQNGATQITQANITDQRLNGTVCGIVTGLIQQVDTTTLFNQYQQWLTQMINSSENEMDQFQSQFENDATAWKQIQETNFSLFKQAFEQAANNWIAQEQQDFNDWFATVQSTLDGDVAGNLLNLINANANRFNQHLEQINTSGIIDKVLATVPVNDILSISKNIIAYAGSTATNKPVASSGFVFNTALDNDNKVVTFTDLLTGVKYYNVKGFGTWRGWKRITTDNELQAIINNLNNHIVESSNKHIHSSGVNANGYWVKFDDGTLICYKTLSVTVSTANTITTTDWVFPVSFVDGWYGLTTVKSSYIENNYTVSRCSLEGFDTTKGTIRFNASYAQQYILALYAIGRWK